MAVVNSAARVDEATQGIFGIDHEYPLSTAYRIVHKLRKLAMLKTAVCFLLHEQGTL